jgi:hypothetical protein
VLGGRVAQAGVRAQLGEDRLCFALAEAEVAKGREDFGVYVGAVGAQRLPVWRAIGVTKDGLGVGVLVGLLDEERAAMGGAGVGGAPRGVG